MSLLPDSGDFDVGTIVDNDDFAANQEAFRAFVQELAGGQPEEALVVAAGAIVPTGALCKVDGEGGAADDLENATQTNHGAGKWLMLRASNALAPLTIKHLAGGGGEFFLADEDDLVLESVNDFVLFYRESDRWREMLRSVQNRFRRVLEIVEVLAAPKVLLPSDCGKYLKGDDGAAATNYATLPPATPGLWFPFGTDSAQKLRLTADGTDTIQRRGTTSGAGGYYETPAEDGFQGEVFCWKAGQWIVRFEEGAGAGSVT